MRKIHIGLGVPVLIAAMIVPSVAGTGPAAKAAQVTGARSATGTGGITRTVTTTGIRPTAGMRAATAAGDFITPLEDEQWCTVHYVCVDTTLWLDETSGDLHAELSSDDNGQHEAIPGSEATLDASGYPDFRNMPYRWRGYVPSSGPNDWYANTPDVFWSTPGVNWWWRACGYVGSDGLCTMSWKVTYSQQTGWDIEQWPS
jgi:hypothetical protein